MKQQHWACFRSQKIKKLIRFLFLVFSTLIILIFVNPSFYYYQAQNQNSESPKTGIIITDNGVVVRDNFSKSTRFSYTLGTRICGLESRTKVNIINQEEITNGEIWYEINLNNIGNCSPFNTGWIIGTFSDGRQAVSIIPSPTPTPSPSPTPTPSPSPTPTPSPSPTPTPSPSPTPTSSQSPTPTSSQSEEQSLGLIELRYIYVSIGTVMAIIITYAEQIINNQSVDTPAKVKESIKKGLLSYIFWYRLVILVIINIICLLLVDSLASLDHNIQKEFGIIGHFVYDLRHLFFKTTGKWLVLLAFNVSGGFIISILMIRFISFVNENGD